MRIFLGEGSLALPVVLNNIKIFKAVKCFITLWKKVSASQ